MKKLILLQIVFISIIVFVFYQITSAGAEESLSAVLSSSKLDYAMVYQYPLMHRDGKVVQLQLIKFNKPACVEVGGEKGCVGGWTSTKSDYTRRYDIEHPVDTTEIIHIEFTKSKIPVVSYEELLHELYHANFIHFMSRPECETNWRYSECQENQAYNYTHLVKQIKQLEKQKKIKLI